MADEKIKAEPCEEESSKTHSFSDLSFTHVATIVYAIMAAAGLLIMIYAHRNLDAAFHWPSTFDARSTIFFSALLVTGILYIATYLCEAWFNAFHYLKMTVAMMIGNRSYGVAIYLALISAIGEELLFRGAIQPFTGLFFASAMFGLAHLGPEGISLWTIWAFCAGLLLGWTYDATNSLWPPILAHFLLNAISMLRLQYLVKRGHIQLPEIPAR